MDEAASAGDFVGQKSRFDTLNVKTEKMDDDLSFGFPLAPISGMLCNFHEQRISTSFLTCKSITDLVTG